MDIAATILIVIGAVAVVRSHVYTLRVAAFEPRLGSPAAVEIKRAKGLRATALASAAVGAAAAAAAAALGHAQTVTWIASAVVLVVALAALYRGLSESIPTALPE